MELRATVTSPSNAAVKAARKLTRGSGRRSGTELLVEGPQAVEAALPHLRRLFVTESAAVREEPLLRAALTGGVEVVPVAGPVLSSLAETVTPQGLVGVAELADADLDEALDGAGLVIVCEEVRDPGNLGAIIRTADAAGADAVVLAGSCVDPRNGKAVRASAGSLFHLPVAPAPDWPALVATCSARGLRLVAADARGSSRHTELDLTVPTALVFGNEAHGLSAAARRASDATVRVPIHGRAESLNLAATVAVVAYEAARQRAGGPR